MKHTVEFIALCDDARARVKEITVDRLFEELDNETYTIIDVRENDEYFAGAIPNAKHLSKGWVEAKAHCVIPDKTSDVILYCGGGNRSLIAADNLQKMGYKNIRSLSGGYKKWLASDFNTVIPQEDSLIEEQQESHS